MRLLATLLVILTNLAALPLMAQEEVDQTQTPRPVVSVIVARQSLPQPDFVGPIAARIAVDLGFPMIGTVAERPARLGDRVAKGDVLARLDPEELTARLRAAEAGVSVAEANASSARDARDRAETLKARGVETQVTLDNATRALAAAEAALTQAQAQRAQAEDLLGLATLSAPQDGIVTATYADQGDTLAAGDPVVQVSGLTQREMLIDLSEADAMRLDPGALFDVQLISEPSITSVATLDRIEPVAAQSTRTRRAHLALIEPPDAFRIGTLARARPQGDGQSAIALPEAAILDDKVWRVSRGAGGATAQLTSVTVAGSLMGYAVITNGISEGDEVITRGIHSLQDGQPVGERIPE
ncbi:efflux RND transporter periplasmic adaptor subunit [Salipiger sp. 1_MG-2023]|uniref:efflux RND transporter periplasmic adaptor subunit n=1 Tax=Salipiger sp. 1_MG-2023 TaxID=3062665 RepID=UPI0026E3A57C|nr:efflux RND transporter periplasmic adaptor subunit [Salipiger sp. 1_MG-2023]MDO6585282.1 efflux RND transporter periplasmic adaptor subunit [Salipiger sp. 1_MG-2023]